MELFKNTNIDFLGKRWTFIGVSLVLTAIGLTSWIGKGGLRYGIDFTGGTNLNLRFSGPPPVEKIRSSVSAKIPGEITVQEISGENSVIIGSPMKGDLALAQDRKLIEEALTATFGQSTGKLDFSNASAQAVAGRLRDPLAQAGAGLSDTAVEALAKTITDFRNSPPRSGLLKSFDELNGLPGVTPKIIEVLNQNFYNAPFQIRSVEQIGPKIGAELQNKAILATLYALGGMLIYIAFRFEWIYGTAAVLAVFHDVVITLGLFSLFNKEITLNVIAALLTLVGYSMNDTIVVFDRIRENLKTNRRDPLAKIVNASINQTLSRTVLTSGLTFLSAAALWIFGGTVLNGFSFALVVGIIIGTYSSIFIASPILIFWHNFVESRKKKAPVASGGPKDRRKG